jgi:hypothetical protein
MLPVIMNTICNSIEDSLGAFLIGEDAHWSGSPPDLAEFPLQDVAGADLFPELPGERIVMEAVEKVFLHAPDRPFFFHLPFLFPGFEALYCFTAAGGVEDMLAISEMGHF